MDRRTDGRTTRLLELHRTAKNGKLSTTTKIFTLYYFNLVHSSVNKNDEFPQFICLVLTGLSLKCYNDGDERIVKCDENLGYRTCFIRYNESKSNIVRHGYS